MQHGNVDGCTCIACTGKKRARVSEPNGASKRASMAKKSLSEVVSMESPRALQKSPAQRPQNKVDEDGAQEVYDILLRDLATRNKLDTPIKQSDSFDWLINRPQIAPLLAKLKSTPRWLPRVTEIVLFRPTNADVGSEAQWQAGVVTQAPDCPLDMAELTAPSDDHENQGTTMTGFRVEPMPEVGSHDKYWSKRSTFVPLHDIRPFQLFREILGDHLVTDYHPTILHAMTVSSSFALFQSYHFRGVWPSATVFCRGIHLGSEMIVVGDVVRLLPNDNATQLVEDVMLITSIKLKFVKLVPSQEKDQQYEVCLHVAGHAYTTDATRAYGMGKVPAQLDLGLEGYGDLYELHDPSKRWEVPYTRVMNRCHEARAMAHYLDDQDALHTLSAGLVGAREARQYSREHDKRILPGKHWYWAETRVDQLDLHEVNDHIVADGVDGEPNRDSAAWLRAVRVRTKGLASTSNETNEQGQNGSTSLTETKTIELSEDEEETAAPTNGDEIEMLD